MNVLVTIITVAVLLMPVFAGLYGIYRGKQYKKQKKLKEHNNE